VHFILGGQSCLCPIVCVIHSSESLKGVILDHSLTKSKPSQFMKLAAQVKSELALWVMYQYQFVIHVASLSVTC
jgi:hypothetical protein